MLLLPLICSVSGPAARYEMMQLLGKSARVTRLDKLLGFLAQYRFIAGIVPAQDDPGTGGHRFNKHDTKTFPAGAGKDGDIGACQILGFFILAYKACKMNDMAKPF